MGGALNIKTASLKGDLKEEVFVRQPKGFEDKPNLRKVYKLYKALYEL